MPDTMRGVYTNLTDIRRSVFREVAKICYSMDPASGKTDDDLDREFDELPFKILPGDVATYRESVFLERAIIGERIRLAMGLPLSSMDKPSRVSEGFSEAETGDQVYYQPPLINVIKFACNACKDNVYMVSDACQGCLAHPCREICPKKAISFKDKKAFIDQDACIKCGMCAKTCPYHAIHHHERPCAAACGMHAIGSDEHGRAEIDYEKCVSCGQCLINCPFGAIADKSQIGQVIWAINSGQEVIAAVAPAFVGQFGGKGNVGKLREAFNHPGGQRLSGRGAREAAVHGHVVLPGLVGHGEARVPRARRVHLDGAHAHDAHGAHDPHPAPQRQDRLRGALLGQEARGHAHVGPQRGRLRAHVRGDGGHDGCPGDRLPRAA